MNDTYTIITTRDIDAPLENVWAAWNNPDTIARWWGPAGFHSTVEELDVREGGCFRVTMHGPDGVDYPNLYIFDRVDPHRQLVYTNVGSEQFGLAPFQSVVDMQRNHNRTLVILKARFTSEEDRRKHIEEFHAIEGSEQLLQRLEEQAR